MLYQFIYLWMLEYQSVIKNIYLYLQINIYCVLNSTIIFIEKIKD